MEGDLEKEYQKAITIGVWEITGFCQSGTKQYLSRRICFSYKRNARKEVVGTTVTVSSQLEDYQHPLGLPIPKDLMGRLGGGYGFTKIDLADTYSQIKLVPKI